MKILLCNKYFFLNGGSEKYLSDLMQQLSRTGHAPIPFSVGYAGSWTSPYSPYFLAPPGPANQTHLEDIRPTLFNWFRFLDRSIYSMEARKSLSRLLKDVQGAEIGYILNIYNYMSPSIIHTFKKHNIPVIVDAAGSVPPIDNLKRFVSAGADLVSFSGGKAIRGPQNSGILCGRRDLIASVALQHLDAAGFSELWDPPETLIPKEKLMGQPRQGIGRAHKVSKESLVGLLMRLKNLSKGKTIDEAKRMERLLDRIADAVEGLPVETTIVHRASEGNGAVPTLKIRMDQKQLGKDAFTISKELRDGDPRLCVNDKSLRDNTLLITAINLNEKLANIVGERLCEVFS